MFKLLVISLVLVFHSCNDAPYAIMTDEYLEINKPGSRYGLIELHVIQIDSRGFPVDEMEISAYTILNRKTLQQVSPDEYLKLYFNKRSDEFIWKVSKDPFSANFYYSDTIHLKPQAWYKLMTERYHFDVYYFLDKMKEKYITRLKPHPGAY